MNKTFSIITVFFGILISFGQNGVINGKIIPEIPEEKKQIAENTKVILNIGNEEKIVFVDKDLNFTFRDLKSDTIRIRTEPKTFGQNIIITGFLEPNETVEIKIPYSLSCKYDKSVNNKTCPICKKSDEVIPISYGLIIEIAKKGEDKKGKEYRAGGCVVSECDPNWYCKRDDYEF